MTGCGHSLLFQCLYSLAIRGEPINIRGKIVPVLDIRSRLHLPPRDMDIKDRVIISKTSSRAIAIIVDKIEAVVEFPQEEILKARQILPDMEGYVEGVGKLNDDTVLIYDINKLFSIEEIRGLMIDDQKTKTHFR